MQGGDRISNFHVIAIAGRLIAQEREHKKNNLSVRSVCTGEEKHHWGRQMSQIAAQTAEHLFP